MAKLVFNNPKITINSVDLTDQIAQVSLDMTFAEVETTAFGNTAVTRVAGLGDHSFGASFHQDFAASEVEASIYPLLGTTTEVTIKAVNSTTATDNPLYTFTVLVSQWAPIAGAVGELLTADITWPVSGGITKTFS
jgi:hypothetical protein